MLFYFSYLRYVLSLDHTPQVWLSILTLYQYLKDDMWAFYGKYIFLIDDLIIYLKIILKLLQCISVTFLLVYTSFEGRLFY